MIDDSTRPADEGGDPVGEGSPAEVSPFPEAITGEPRVDEALARLADLGDEPGPEHVEAFEHAHGRLHGMLDELARPRPETPPDSHTARRGAGEPEAPNGQAEQA
jgi:hypothetical protein